MSTPICWLASYPKSGNTWVRFLLHQYLFGRAERSEEVAEAVPDVHGLGGVLEGRQFETRFGAMTLAKTHHRCSASMPFASRSLQAVYVARHPRDVMWSCLNYARLVCAPEVVARITPRGFARNFIHLGGDPQFIQFGYGSLLEHATSWLGSDAVPTLVIRYEDLRRDTSHALSEMLAFLGVEADAARVERAVEDSSFERMRAIEESDAADGRGARVFAARPDSREAGNRFMNAGTLGRSLDEIEPGLDAALEARFRAFLDLTGYERNATSAEQAKA